MVRAALFTFGLLVGSIGSFGGLMLQPYSLFILRNESAETMRVTVEASGRTVWAGDLRADGRQMALSIVDRDTGITVTCATPRTAAATVRSNYMTGGIPPQIATIRLPSCTKPHTWVHMQP